MIKTVFVSLFSVFIAFTGIAQEGNITKEELLDETPRKDAATLIRLQMGLPLNKKNTQNEYEYSKEMDFTKEELLGKIEPSTHLEFIKIPSDYTTKPNSIYLRKDVLTAYRKLKEAAQKEGFDLQILSATRNFDYQKGIWDRKWDNLASSGKSDLEKVKDIMTYSSMPGTSRHHWGTDIDLNSLNNSYFESGEGKRLYDWLKKNAPEFGFHQTYTNQESGRTGYAEEKWHWTYLPISEEMLMQYKEKVSYSDITGFRGSEQAKEVKAIENYVNGIDEQLKD